MIRIAILALCLLSVPCIAAEPRLGVCVEVLDGEPVTIRINGIDAPEIGQRFGSEAKTFLSKHLLGHEVDVVASGTDRYQRMLADVSRKMQPDRIRSDKSTGTFNASMDMVRNGLAWHYVKYSDDIELAKLQNKARGERLCIRQDARTVAPWDYRNGQRIASSLPRNVESTRTTDELRHQERHEIPSAGLSVFVEVHDRHSIESRGCVRALFSV